MNARAAVAEFAGTAFLLAAIVGSEIMAERLCGGNTGLALLANALATRPQVTASRSYCSSAATTPDGRRWRRRTCDISPATAST